jgi:cupin fold WbuC family metalloprotein
MLIASHHETYVAPHMHPTKSETFLILEGFADVFLFDDDGGLKERIAMGPASSNRPFFYRMPARQFHALTIASDVLVFVESTKGPFNSSQTVNATWAPAPDQTQEGREYLRKISEAEPVGSMGVGACQTSSRSSQ